MKHYEIVFLVHPDQSDQVPAMTKRIVSIVKDSGGKVHRSEDWKRRQLAYPIAKVHKAHYLLMNVECTLDSMKQIGEYFRFNEAVLRNLVLDVGRAITVPSPIRPTESQDEADMDKEKAESRPKQEVSEADLEVPAVEEAVAAADNAEADEADAESDEPEAETEPETDEPEAETEKTEEAEAS